MFPPKGEAEGEPNWSTQAGGRCELLQAKHDEIEARENFHTLANSIPQLAWMADASGYIFWYNQRWYDYTGTTLEEMQGWGWQKVHHPDEVDRVVERIKQAFETGEPWEDVFPLRSCDGEYRWFLSRALPIRDEEGSVVRWFGTNTDVTEQRQLEQELRKAREELEQRVSERTYELSRANFGLREQVAERRRAEQSLLKQTEILKSILNQMGDPVVVADRDEKFLIFNPAAERMFGAGATATPAAEWPERYGLFLPDQVTPFPHDELPLSRAIRGEEVDDIEIFVRHASAPEGLWTRITGRPLRDAAGELAGGVAVCRDITERKLAEEAQRESEEKYRTLFESIDEGFCVFDMIYEATGRAIDFIFRVTNPAFERQTGLQNAVGRRVSELLPDLEEVWVKKYEQVAATGEPQRFTEHAAGLNKWYEVYSFRVGAAGSNRVAVLFSDITVRKQAEEALSREKEFSDTSIDSLPGVFYHYDKTGRFLRWNRNFETVTGYSHEEIGQMHPLDFFAGDDKRLIEERIGRVFETGEGDAEADFVCKDGRAIPYYFTGRRVLFDGEPYLVGVGIDIAERRRAEEALSQVQSDLARMSRVTALGELAASIAHEVNQPLTSVIGNAEICLESFSGETPDLAEAREVLADICKDGRRASEILKRIRNLVRKGEPQRTLLDINEVIGEVISLVASAAGAKRVRTQSRQCADLPQVLGDRVQVQQVLLNLLVNAMDAMGAVPEEQRELVVETHVDDERGGVLVAVRDRGPGLTAEDAEKVFGAFYTTKAEGMGMGLSISRSIIRTHGGRLWVEPNQGGGASFLFTLPPAEVTP